MKTWKIILLVVAGSLAIVLIYPGIPANTTLETNLLTARKYAVLHCYYLHWTGLRLKNVDVSSEIKDSSIHVGKEPCYRWINWDPMTSS